MPLRVLVVLVVVTLGAAACADDTDDPAGAAAPTTAAPPSTEASPTTAPPPTTPASSTTAVPAPGLYAGYESELYADPATWICRPGADDVCSGDNDLTLVAADGTLEVVPFEPAGGTAPVDCFYVYPTISRDVTANADLIPGEDEEIFTVRSQAARYGEVCNVYAPVYRQVSLLGIFDNVSEDAAVVEEGASPRDIAYGDVVDAFTHYMANDNGGRGVVLLGHSQGAGHLRRLIAEEIDGNPEWDEQFVAAHILGSGVAPGPAGSFTSVPACTEVGQLGCVVSYATFRTSSPPPPDSLFGRVDDAPALCTNPADLAGGPAMLRPEFLTGSGAMAGVSPLVDEAAAAAITTPWVGYPDFIEGGCVEDGTFGWLAIDVMGDPADARLDDIGGELTPVWGMHLVDAQVALGDLVDLVEAQVAAWTAG